MARVYLLTNAQAQAERLKKFSDEIKEVKDKVSRIKVKNTNYTENLNKAMTALDNAIEELEKYLQNAKDAVDSLSNNVVAVAQDIYSRELAEEMERKANGN